MYKCSEPVFVNIFKEPRYRFQPGGPVRQPYLTYRPSRLHRLAESISWNLFLGSFNVYKFWLWYLYCKPICVCVKIHGVCLYLCECLIISYILIFIKACRGKYVLICRQMHCFTTEHLSFRRLERIFAGLIFALRKKMSFASARTWVIVWLCYYGSNKSYKSKMLLFGNWETYIILLGIIPLVYMTVIHFDDPE